MLIWAEASRCGPAAGTRSRGRRCIRRGKRRRIPSVSAGMNLTPVPLMRLSSSPSSHCGFPTGPTVELWSNIYRRGTSGRPSADGVASGSYQLRREKRDLKLPALVGCDLLGTAEKSNPDGDEDLRDCFGGDLRERECLRSTGVPLEGSETVPEARRERQWADQVDTHMRKTCRREFETLERGLYVARYLGKLAGWTRACPCGQSFPTPGHKNHWDTNLTVALAPRCLRPWRVSKT